MLRESFDLIVIGGGSGGYVASIRASQLDLKTALIEREHLGGICLNWGCVPMKSLLNSAEVYRQIGNAGSLGVFVSDIRLDFKKIVQRSRMVAEKPRAGVRHLLKKNRVTVFEGAGPLLGPGRLSIL